MLTLMEDSRTTNRWFITVVMGRKAGHLALGIGKAAGATLTVIPEEFTAEKITLDEIARVIEGSILKRRLTGQGYGTAVVAEGVGERLDPEELKSYAGVEVSYDPYGNVQLADIPARLADQAGDQAPFRGPRRQGPDYRHHAGLRAALRRPDPL